MPSRDFLGEFEHIVLLGRLLRLENDAYGVTVRQEIESRTKREVSIGAIYATLDRLEVKAYVRSLPWRSHARNVRKREVQAFLPRHRKGYPSYEPHSLCAGPNDARAGYGRETRMMPPHIASWLITLFVPQNEAQEIQGDLLEEFLKLASHNGVGAARSWYWRQTIKTVASMFFDGSRAAQWMIAVIAAWFLSGYVDQGNQRIAATFLSNFDVYRYVSPYVFWFFYAIVSSRMRPHPPDAALEVYWHWQPQKGRW